MLRYGMRRLWQRRNIESQTGYECDHAALYMGEGTFEAKGDTLYLQCDCGHKTAVSEATATMNLKPYLISRMVEAMQQSITGIFNMVIELRAVCLYLVMT